MLDVAPTELLLIAIIALLVIGPKDLPKAMRFVGNWVGKAKRTAAHFRTGIDTMMREAELEEMEKKWKAENERIMREHPPTAHHPDPEPAALPAPDPAAPATDSDDDQPAQVARPVIRDDPELPLDPPARVAPDSDKLP
jgi:sec-independent protein translocase protein TatB